MPAPALGQLSSCLAELMAARLVCPMHPILALQSFMGPIYLHPMRRPVGERVADLAAELPDTVDWPVAAAPVGPEPRS